MNVIQITDTSGKITWDEPANKNGLLTAYEIVVETLGPDYDVPEGCGVNKEIYTPKIDAANTEYLFSEGLPYHWYSVVIKAFTRQGYGSASETAPFRTSEGGECFVLEHNLNEVRLMMRRETVTVTAIENDQ